MGVILPRLLQDANSASVHQELAHYLSQTDAVAPGQGSLLHTVACEQKLLVLVF